MKKVFSHKMQWRKIIQPFSLELAVKAFVLHKKTRCSEDLRFFPVVHKKTSGLMDFSDSFKLNDL